MRLAERVRRLALGLLPGADDRVVEGRCATILPVAVWGGTRKLARRGSVTSVSSVVKGPSLATEHAKATIQAGQVDQEALVLGALSEPGFVGLSLLVLVCPKTRELFCSITPKRPTYARVTEQVSALVEWSPIADGASDAIRDRDTKFVAEFRVALRKAGIKCRELPVRSPNLNSPFEPFIRRLEHEMLGRFVVLGRDHLACRVSAFVAHDNRERPRGRRYHRPPRGGRRRPPSVPCHNEVRAAEQLIWAWFSWGTKSGDQLVRRGGRAKTP